MPQEILRSLLGRTIESDPDASGNVYLLLAQIKGRLQNLCDPFCDANGIIYVGNVFDQDTKFVPPKRAALS